MIEFPISGWFYHSEFQPNKDSQHIIDKFEQLKADGYNIVFQYSGVGFWRRYWGRFESEEQAALFKLTHM